MQTSLDQVQRFGDSRVALIGFPSVRILGTNTLEYFCQVNPEALAVLGHRRVPAKLEDVVTIQPSRWYALSSAACVTLNSCHKCSFGDANSKNSAECLESAAAHRTSLSAKVGKSSLLTALTGVQSEAAAYEFTTLTCIPGWWAR